MKVSISRDEFAQLAGRKVERTSGGEKTEPVVVEGLNLQLIPREVRDGKSLGFTILGKVHVPFELEGETYVLPCQINGTCTVIGSKPVELEEAA